MFGLGDRFDAARSAADHWKREVRSTKGVNRWNLLASFLLASAAAGTFMIQYWVICGSLLVAALLALFMNKEVAATTLKVGTLLIGTGAVGALGYWLGGLMGWPEAGAFVFVCGALFFGAKRID